LFDETKKMIEKLIKYYSVKKPTNNNKAFIMKYLCKNFPALFTVKEVSIDFDPICYILFLFKIMT